MWSGAFSRFGLKAVRLTRPLLTSKPTLVTVGVGAPLAALFGMSKKDKPETPATGRPSADTNKAIGATPSETLGTNPEKARHKAATLEGTHDKTVDEGKTAASGSGADPDPEKLDVDLYKFSGDSSHPKEILPAPVSFAPLVPPPIKRSHPVVLRVNLDSIVAEMSLTNKYKYPFWTYNGKTPGPFIRARVGDVLEVVHTNKDQSGMPHNIDFHAAVGPGGGAPLTLAEMDQTKIARFKLTYPGLYVYHCGAAPVPVHIANGMYGLILVEPEKGMPAADKEFYVMQSEFYIEPPENGGTQIAECNYAAGLLEEPEIVVFNGREGALTQKEVLKATTDERVRIYFGNAGPNLTASFHVIGGIFDKVYRDADLITPPGQGIAVTSVPPGGATVVELQPKVPGIYTLVDHAIFRLDKGAVGFLSVSGKTRPDLYCSRDAPQNCPGCKLHA